MVVWFRKAIFKLLLWRYDLRRVFLIGNLHQLAGEESSYRHLFTIGGGAINHARPYIIYPFIGLSGESGHKETLIYLPQLRGSIKRP